MNIKMYKAIDSLDGKESLFAVFGDRFAVSHYLGQQDPWLNIDDFDIKDCIHQELNVSRMIDPVLIWEKFV